MIQQTSIRCPNHSCPLEGIPNPTPRKGTGICPVSGAPFEFESDTEPNVLRQDKNGNIIPTKWDINGND